MFDIKKLKHCMENGHEPVPVTVLKGIKRIDTPFALPSKATINVCGRCGVVYLDATNAKVSLGSRGR